MVNIVPFYIQYREYRYYSSILGVFLSTKFEKTLTVFFLFFLVDTPHSLTFYVILPSPMDFLFLIFSFISLFIRYFSMVIVVVRAKCVISIYWFLSIKEIYVIWRGNCRQKFCRKGFFYGKWLSLSQDINVNYYYASEIMDFLWFWNSK